MWVADAIVQGHQQSSSVSDALQYVYVTHHGDLWGDACAAALCWVVSVDRQHLLPMWLVTDCACEAWLLLRLPPWDSGVASSSENNKLSISPALYTGSRAFCLCVSTSVGWKVLNVRLCRSESSHFMVPGIYSIVIVVADRTEACHVLYDTIAFTNPGDDSVLCTLLPARHTDCWMWCRSTFCKE